MRGFSRLSGARRQRGRFFNSETVGSGVLRLLRIQRSRSIEIHKLYFFNCLFGNKRLSPHRIALSACQPLGPINTARCQNILLECYFHPFFREVLRRKLVNQIFKNPHTRDNLKLKFRDHYNTNRDVSKHRNATFKIKMCINYLNRFLVLKLIKIFCFTIYFTNERPTFVFVANFELKIMRILNNYETRLLVNG